MKKQVIKWILRLALAVLFIASLVSIIAINPILSYANKTKHNNLTIYHHAKFDLLLTSQLDNATNLLKTSEFYNEPLKLDICLNDGSKYTDLIKAIRGQAFAWGFYDKVVLQGAMNCKENF